MASSASPQNARRRLEAARVNIFLHTENRLIFGERPRRTLPVTVVTGYLGAGKTTLLTHILSNRSNLRVAALINDFAALNIDEDLVRAKGTSERVVELSNGCVCCHLIGDLETAVWDMLKEGSDVDLDEINYLLVETSGVSDPARIIQSIEAKFGKMYRARLDSVVTVIDADLMLPQRVGALATIESPGGAARGEEQERQERQTHDARSLQLRGAALSQIECADVILLNKADLVDEDRLAACEQVIHSYNPTATLHRTVRSDVPLEAILDVSSAPLVGAGTGQAQPISHEGTEAPFYISATGGALRSGGSARALSKPNDKGDSNNNTDTHLSRDKFHTVSVEVDAAPLDLARLQIFLQSSLPSGLVRMKGVLWVRGPGSRLASKRCVVHMSGRFRLGFELDGEWEGPPSSRMAFIGRDLDATALEAAFRGLAMGAKEGDGDSERKYACMSWLKDSSVFELCPVDEKGLDDPATCSVLRFRLTGTNLYGYSVAQMRTELRMDVDDMNRRLADAVNASIDVPKAFICYDTLREDGSVVLCHALAMSGEAGAGSVTSEQVAGNAVVLTREAEKILQNAFRNVASCACGQ